jgi:predicted enzyme related to lactoylglutathione lyase
MTCIATEEPPLVTVDNMGGRQVSEMEKARLVMFWRRVKDINAVPEDLARRGILWNHIGFDPLGCTHAIVGATIVMGYWLQDKSVLDARRAVSVDYEQSELVFNPTSEIVVSSSKANLQSSVGQLATEYGFHTSTTRRFEGESISFVDDGGNVTSIVSLSTKFMQTRAGHLFSAATSAVQTVETPVVGRLQKVRNLSESVAFYRDVLGIRVLGGRKEVRLAPGLAQIILVQEEEHGSLANLRARNRLLPDWNLLYTENIEQAVRELSESGVQFQHGIENTDYGPVAHFTDPNGHSIALWQKYETVPQGGNDVWPAIRNILDACNSVLRNA